MTGASAVTSMNVYASSNNPLGALESLGLAVGLGADPITLSDPVMDVGTTVYVGGVDVGTVTTRNSDGFKITFNAAATTERLDALLHNLTYSNQSTSPPICALTFYVGFQDSGGISEASTTVATLPASAIYAQSNTSHIGTEQANLYFVYSKQLLPYIDCRRRWNRTRSSIIIHPLGRFI